MALSLTPLNDAWMMNNKQQVKKVAQKGSPKSRRPQNNGNNIYSSPQVQSKILGELGMIQMEPEPEVIEKTIEYMQNKDSLNISITNPQLLNMLKPYSNQYIELIILQCMSNQSSNKMSDEMINTIETIYIMVSIILVLLLIDVVFKMKSN